MSDYKVSVYNQSPHNLSLRQGILNVMSSTATSDAALVMAEAAKESASKDKSTRIDEEFIKGTSLDDIDLSETPPKIKGVVSSKLTNSHTEEVLLHSQDLWLQGQVQQSSL